MAKTTKTDAYQAPTPEAVCRTRRTDIRQLINEIEIEMTDGGALTENGWGDAAMIAAAKTLQDAGRNVRIVFFFDC